MRARRGKFSLQAGRDQARQGLHGVASHPAVLLVCREAGGSRQPDQLPEVQAESTGVFVHADRKDGHAGAGEEGNEAARPGGRPGEPSAGLVPARLRGDFAASPAELPLPVNPNKP